MAELSSYDLRRKASLGMLRRKVKSVFLFVSLLPKLPLWFWCFISWHAFSFHVPRFSCLGFPILPIPKCAGMILWGMWFSEGDCAMLLQFSLYQMIVNRRWRQLLKACTPPWIRKSHPPRPFRKFSSLGIIVRMRLASALQILG